MKLEKAIQMATEIAYEDDEDQMVGLIDGTWQVAGWEDEGRINRMATSPRFIVNDHGPDLEDVMKELDQAGVRSKLDPVGTTWTFADGQQVTIRGMELSFSG